MHLKKTSKKMTAFEIYAAVLLNDSDKNFKNIGLVVELMFCISPSVAMIERSFSTMNTIKTKLRSSIGQDMLNKLMHISMTDIDLEDENSMFSYWVNLSKVSSTKRLRIGKVNIPKLMNMRTKYKKRKSKQSKENPTKKAKK